MNVSNDTHTHQRVVSALLRILPIRIPIGIPIQIPIQIPKPIPKRIPSGALTSAPGPLDERTLHGALDSHGSF